MTRVNSLDELVENAAKAFLARWYDWHGDAEAWWMALTPDRRHAALEAAAALLSSQREEIERLNAQVKALGKAARIIEARSLSHEGGV